MCYFFIIGKICFVAGWNGFVGRIWPPHRSVENPDIDSEEEWWQHTPFLESNNDRLWFNPVDGDTIFWTGIRIQLLDGQQQAPVNTVLHNITPSFSRGTRPYSFPRSTKRVYKRVSLACSQDFLKNLLESRNFFCSATAATKTTLGIIQLCFNYFRGIVAYTLLESMGVGRIFPGGGALAEFS